MEGSVAKAQARRPTRTIPLLICSAIGAVGLLAEVTRVEIREWDVPSPRSRPHDPAVAPDGAMVATPDGRLYLACSGVNKVSVARVIR